MNQCSSFIYLARMQFRADGAGKVNASHGGEKEWKHQNDVLRSSAEFHSKAGKLIRLEFPRTEIQHFGDVAVVWSTYILETEVDGKRSSGSTLESKTEAIGRKALDLECKNRSENELKFFAVHGYWPEVADVVEPIESSFTTHGLKTTVILEKVDPAPTENRCWPVQERGAVGGRR